ncbi:MAG TPA: zinc ribbon domain-containing protein [Thermoanaerobaculia bacterium]|nr:zinc ribbon domain-containing protein [Thermoanaerobaculia bacterium]
MPLYEYRCSDCDHRFEILQRIGQGADGLACPKCGVPHLEKQFSTFSASTATGGGAMESAPSCGAPSCCRGMGGCGTDFS